MGIYEYPDKYIIVTLDTLEHGGGIETDKITVVPKDINNLEFSELILNHLELSKSGIKNFDKNKRKKDMIKATGLKTLKAQMQDSKYVSINRINEKYSISPTVNGGTSGPNRGYRYKNKAEFNSIENIYEIGILVKNGFELSE